jgi:hypothetical protein
MRFPVCWNSIDRKNAADVSTPLAARQFVSAPHDSMLFVQN